MKLRIEVEAGMPPITFSKDADSDTITSVLLGWYVVAWRTNGTAVEGVVEPMPNDHMGDPSLRLIEEVTGIEHIVPLFTIARIEMA